MESGELTPGNEFHLYAGIAAAKRGITAIIDYDYQGNNRSFLYDETTETATPLIDRGKQAILSAYGFIFGTRRPCRDRPECQFANATRH